MFKRIFSRTIFILICLLFAIQLILTGQETAYATTVIDTWQIGIPHGGVALARDGAVEYPRTDSWVSTFHYTVAASSNPDTYPSMPGYMGNFNACDVDPGHPCTDATAELIIHFTLACSYASNELTFIYDRYGSETDHVYLDNTHIYTVSGSGEAGFVPSSINLGNISSGNHALKIKYMGGGSNSGHYIDYLELTSTVACELPTATPTLLPPTSTPTPSPSPTATPAPNIIYVDGNATGTNNGNSWGNAYIHLQDALASAVSGDEIWVAAGIYKPTTGTSPSSTFNLKNGVAIYGGFDGTETTLSERDCQSHETILSGDLLGNDNTNINRNDPTRADNSYHVVRSNSSIDESAILDCFTIISGNSVGNRGGGGIENNGSPALHNLIIENNAARSGGGMTNVGGSSGASLYNVVFHNNSANIGGGMYSQGGTASLTNTIFDSNTSSSTGGGMYNAASDLVFSGVTFVDNTASNNGGGLINTLISTLTFTDVTFTGNTSGAKGGGLHIAAQTNLVIVNGTFNGNVASQQGGGLYSYGNAFELSNVIFSGNYAGTYGGGIADYNSNSSSNIVNVTFSGNRASTSGGAMYNTHNTPAIRNSIFWDNRDNSGTGSSANIAGYNSTPDVKYSIVQGGWTGIGNIDANPLFINPINSSSAPNSSGDFHVATNSPALDAGDNDVVLSDITDLDSDSDVSEPTPWDRDGLGRFLDSAATDTGNGSSSIVDLGAYESPN